MKQNSKREKAGYLLDEIGNIDDRFLAEALAAPRTSRTIRLRKKSNTWRYLLIAASLILVITAGFNGILALFRHSDKSSLPGQNDAPGTVTPALAPLDRLLQACTESDSFRLSSADEIDFFDGTVRLTVKNTATGELFVSRPLTGSETSALRRELESASAQPFTGDTSAYRVWVMLGDGQVVTPCLTPSAGNIGAADLFDYESECVPTRIFTDLLTGMI